MWPEKGASATQKRVPLNAHVARCTVAMACAPTGERVRGSLQACWRSRPRRGQWHSRCSVTSHSDVASGRSLCSGPSMSSSSWRRVSVKRGSRGARLPSRRAFATCRRSPDGSAGSPSEGAERRPKPVVLRGRHPVAQHGTSHLSSAPERRSRLSSLAHTPCRHRNAGSHVSLTLGAEKLCGKVIRSGFRAHDHATSDSTAGLARGSVR